MHIAERQRVEQSLSANDIEQLVHDHQAMVWRYLRSLGCEAALAEDLTQETFVRVFQRPFEERSEAQTRAWLRTVARNLFISHMRKIGRRPSEQTLDGVEAEWARMVGDEDDGSELLEALNDCFHQLTPRVQAALDLRYKNRESREDMARKLDMAPDGVKTLLRRARNALKSCIERRVNHA